MPFVQPLCTQQAQGFAGVNLETDDVFTRARWFEDMAKVTSFYHANGSGTVVDLNTGFPVSGPSSLSVVFAGDDKYPSGSYTMSWTGGGTGPTAHTVTPGQGQVNFNYSGDLADYSFHRDGAAATYTPTFVQRADCARIVRLMDAWRTNQTEFDASFPWVRVVVGASNTFYKKLITPQDVVALSNATQSHVWVCMHWLSTEPHWTAVGNVLKDCWGDVVVEFGNEAWNPGFAYYQNSKAITPGLGYTGGEFQQVMSYHLDQCNAMGVALHAIDANKFIVTFSGQQTTLFSWTGAKAGAMGPHTDIDALTISGYHGGPWARAQTPATILGMTYADIVAEAENEWDTVVNGGTDNIGTWLTQAAADSKRLLLYEWGLHLENGDPAADVHLYNASQSAEAGVLETRVGNEIQSRINDYNCLYRDIGTEDAWACKPFELSTGSPRWLAWKAMAC